MSFWQNVENELQYRNMSRKELAEKAGFAVSGISLGISNNSIPKADIAVRIAQTLGVSVEYLVTGSTPQSPTKENAPTIARITASLNTLPTYDLETLAILVERMKNK